MVLTWPRWAPTLLLAGWASCVRGPPPELAEPPQRAGEGSVFDDMGAARSWYLRARVAEAQGDLAEADRAMGWLLRQGRGWASTWVVVGDYRLRNGRADEAVQAYFEAIDRSPDDPAAHLGLARAWLASGHEREAWEQVVRARALQAVGVEEVAVAVALRRGEPAVALEALEAWLAVPEVADARLRRAEAALAVGWASPAVDDLLALLGHLTLDGAARALLPEAAARACRVDDVARRLAPGGAGAAEEGLGEVSALLAAEDYETVLERTVEVTSPSLGWARAGALTALGRAHEAEAVVRATARSPEDAARRLARLKRLGGDDEGAWAALRDAGLVVEAAWVVPDQADFAALVADHPTSGLAWLGLARAGDASAVGPALRFGACDAAALASAAERLPPCDAVRLWERATVAAPADAALGDALALSRQQCEAS